jgi:hypothetical protein
MYGHGRDEIDINGDKNIQRKKRKQELYAERAKTVIVGPTGKERCTGDIRIFSPPREKVLFFFFLGTILLSTKTKWESRSGRRR